MRKTKVAFIDVSPGDVVIMPGSNPYLKPFIFKPNDSDFGNLIYPERRGQKELFWRAHMEGKIVGGNKGQLGKVKVIKYA